MIITETALKMLGGVEHKGVWTLNKIHPDTTLEKRVGADSWLLTLRYFDSGLPLKAKEVEVVILGRAL